MALDPETPDASNPDHEGQNFTPIKYKPAIHTWLVTVTGLILRIIGLIFLFFGLVIFFDDTLRSNFINWGVASIIAFAFLWFSGKFLINRYGAQSFTIESDRFEIKTPLGKNFTIYIDDVAHVGVNKPNPILELFALSSPSVTIVTYNRLAKFRTKNWKKSEEFYRRFERLSEHVTDDFAEYYHRTNRSFQQFIRRISRDTSGVIGLTIISIYSFLAIWGAFAMLISPPGSYSTHTLFLRNPEFLYAYFTEEHADQLWAPPSQDFWFGTDFVGRDVFARIIFGTSWTFLIAIIGSVIGISFVIFFGITSAYFGGTYDSVVMRIADALLSFPPFILLLLFASLSEPLRVEIPGGYFMAVYTGMAFVSWPLGARLIRSEVNEILNKEYIIAAKQIGASDFRIIFHHIIPKIIPTLLVLFSFLFTDIIIGTTLLGFIGFGAESTLIWGSDINKAILFDSEIDPTLSKHWWTWLFPTTALFILVVGLTLFSDSVRDNLDPHLRGGIEAVPYEQRLELGL